jgi:hypothetical protein
MTTQQLFLFNGLYSIILIIVAVLTRVTSRRIAGALAGGTAMGLVALGIIDAGEMFNWWHMAICWEPYFPALLWIDFALCAANRSSMNAQSMRAELREITICGSPPALRHL